VKTLRLKRMAYLIRTQVLHRVDIDNGELVTGDERIDPLQGRLEVSEKTSEIDVHDGRCWCTCLFAHWVTNHEARPPLLGSHAFGQLDGAMSCEFYVTFSSNTRVVWCKGIVELEDDVQPTARDGSRKQSHTPVDSMVILCWYCPSRG